MNFKWKPALAVMLLAVASAPAALAQTTGRIDGWATDESGSALPGVTVSVASSSLQGERLTITGADGRFRFLNLGPGSYTLRARLDGFTTLEQAGISVTLDRTVTMQLKMSPQEEFGEEVTVRGAPPIIDATTTTSGAIFDEKLIADLPVGRTFEALAFAAPGVVDGGIGGNPSIGGASSAENRYIINGLDTTDPAFGTLGTSVPVDFVKELEVKTGGYEAEYGGALGGVLNVVTKSGGNELRGDVFGYWTDDSLQAGSPGTVDFGRNLGFTEYDFGAALGGKLIRDRLWYFVALNPSFTERKTENRGGLSNTETEQSIYYTGKLTWQASLSHQLVLTAFGDPATRDDEPILNAAGKIANNREFGANSVGLTYNGTLTPSLFVEATAGHFGENVSQTPVRDVPLYQVLRFDSQIPGAIGELLAPQLGPCYQVGQYDSPFSIAPDCVGGTFEQESGDTLRDEARASVSWFTETGPVDHEIKFGGIGRRVEYRDVAHYPAPYDQPLIDANGINVAPDGLAGQRLQLFQDFYFFNDYDQSSRGQTDEQAIFLQDQIRLNDFFTVSLGVRADAYKATGDRSNLVIGDGLSPGFDFGYGDTVAPRVGFTWDVVGNGRSKLYGHYGKFYESVPLDINARVFGNEEFNFHYFYYPTDGTLPTASNPGAWFYSNLNRSVLGVDADVQPPYTQESLVGFEYEVLPTIAMGIKYTERSIENVIEDISVDGGRLYFVTNPNKTYTVHPLLGLPLPAPVTYPEPTRNYRAVELTLNRRFRDNWQLYASYVNAENKGNYGGLYVQDNGQLDPHISLLYDLPSLLVNADGLLPNDREHQLKAYGSYLWPFKLITGFYAQWLSGTPISRLGAHAVYGADTRFVYPRGSAGRTPDVWNLDLHLEYPFQLAKGMDVRLVGDVFNITDNQAAVEVDQTWTFSRSNFTPDPPECGGPGTGPGTACELGNPDFGKPTRFQTPRTVRFGVKLAF